MSSAFHQMCPRYRGTLTPIAPTALRLLGYGKPLPLKKKKKKKHWSYDLNILSVVSSYEAMWSSVS